MIWRGLDNSTSDKLGMSLHDLGSKALAPPWVSRLHDFVMWIFLRICRLAANQYINQINTMEEFVTGDKNEVLLVGSFVLDSSTLSGVYRQLVRTWLLALRRNVKAYNATRESTRRGSLYLITEIFWMLWFFAVLLVIDPEFCTPYSIYINALKMTTKGQTTMRDQRSLVVFMAVFSIVTTESTRASTLHLPSTLPNTKETDRLSSWACFQLCWWQRMLGCIRIFVRRQGSERQAACNCDARHYLRRRFLPAKS